MLKRFTHDPFLHTEPKIFLTGESVKLYTPNSLQGKPIGEFMLDAHFRPIAP